MLMQISQSKHSEHLTMKIAVKATMMGKLFFLEKTLKNSCSLFCQYVKNLNLHSLLGSKVFYFFIFFILGSKVNNFRHFPQGTVDHISNVA